MNIPTCKIDACEYKNLPSCTQVFNINTFEYYVYVYLPPELCRSLQLYRVDKISPDAHEVPIRGFIERENTCWIKIKSEILSKNAGQHVYKLSFVNTVSRGTAGLYFSYIIQDDNPDKPYIYMDKYKSDLSEVK